MIYRFLSAQNPEFVRGKWDFHRFGGVFVRGVLSINVPSPTKKIPEKARFFFTEKGYKINVNLILKSAKQEGQIIKVVSLKEPAASRVVYHDEWQVAVLPLAKRKRRKETRNT